MSSRDENRMMQTSKPNLSMIIHSMLDESSSSKVRSKVSKLVQTLKNPKSVIPVSSQSQTGSRAYPTHKIQRDVTPNSVIKNRKKGRRQLTRRPRF